ncbi:MAG: hypothetical protein ACJAWW_001236 [Sulfurimonas sp.]|jgi:hypothetical protein
MKKNQNILSSVLLVSSLTLTLTITTSLTANTQFNVNSISNSIATTLYNKGLDEDVSKELAENVLNIDENLFALMLHNLQHGYNNKLSKTEILNFLSTQALMKKSIHLNSYSYLVNMLYQIKNKALDKNNLKSLDAIATKNSIYLKG